MTFYTGLARVARDAGLTVREVPGWKTRTAHRGGMNAVKAVVWHHTATPAAAVKSRNNPTLNYMVSGLGYPLCNYALAWDGSLDVIAAGTGAHAGVGSYRGIPDGNRNAIGIEVEGTIGLTWSDAQLEAAARLGAALDREWGGLIHIGHYEWAPRRKTDPSGIPGNMPALRAAIKRGHWGTLTPAATPKGELTVTQIEDITKRLDSIDKAVSNVPRLVWDGHELTMPDGTKVYPSTLQVYTREGIRPVAATAGRVAGLEELVKQLATGEGVAIDYDRVEEAARAGVAEAIADSVSVEGVLTVTSKKEN